MSEQPQSPNPSTIIAIQKQEIDRLNDNRVWLLAVAQENQNGALGEINRLMGVISQLKGMLEADVLEEAEAIINGTPPK